LQEQGKETDKKQEGGATTVDEAAVKNLIFEALPCATNKTCKEVSEIKGELNKEVSEMKGELKDVKRILIALIMLVLSTLAAVIVK